MKYTIIILLSLGFSLPMISQNNCGDTEPVATCPTDLDLCYTEANDAITIVTASNLPTLEYAIVDNSLPASSGTGGTIISIDLDGIVQPDLIGAIQPTTLDIYPVAYDLPAIQSLIDEVLTGSVPFLGSCCGIITTFSGVDICDTLMMNGITSGSSITSIADLFPLLGDDLSVVDFQDAVDSLNMELGNLPSQCGGDIPICYAFGNACTFNVLNDNLTIAMPDHAVSEEISVAETIFSTAQVNAGLDVKYKAGLCIELLSDFSTVNSSDFSAEIESCQ